MHNDPEHRQWAEIAAADEMARAEEHNNKWEPILRTHAMADAFDRIALLLEDATEDQLQIVAPSIRVETVPAFVDLYRDKANRLRAAFPVAPLTDDERQTVWEIVYDMAGDMSTKDTARTLVQIWNDAEWREQLEQDALFADYED